VINSCASNSVTGETVCTANDNHVYVCSGRTCNLLPDPSDGTGTLTSSGGTCTNFARRPPCSRPRPIRGSKSVERGPASRGPPGRSASSRHPMPSRPAMTDHEVAPSTCHRCGFISSARVRTGRPPGPSGCGDPADRDVSAHGDLARLERMFADGLRQRAHEARPCGLANIGGGFPPGPNAPTPTITRRSST
jgi:hypothetical protein